MISAEMEKSNGFKIWGRGAVNPTGLTCGLNVENERFKKKKGKDES